MGAPGGRQRARAWVAVLAILCAGCGSTSSLPPGAASTASVQVAAATARGTPGPTIAAPEPAGSSPAAATPGSSSAPAATPAPSPTVAPLPSPGRAHVFACASLASAAQVTRATGVQQFLLDASNLPFGGKTVKLPKGETQCKYIGQGTKGGQAIVVVVDLTILTDGARSTFDKTWYANRASSIVTTVGGVGDDAAWMAAQDTLVGIAGPTAFVITLEPTPFTFYTPSGARAAAVSIARTVLPHL